jgi:dTDP-4-amino-4,6-dideoxygalactose transaminase
MTGSDAFGQLDIPAARIVFSAADRDEISRRVGAALASGALTLGANTRDFEELFGELHSVPHTVAVSSGTAALEIILRAVDVAGTDVIVPANTFAATAFSVLSAGAQPVFADVDAATFALSVETVEAALTPATSAVVVVHIGGFITPEITALKRLCDRHGIALIEDAAHAHGSSRDGVHAGSFGLAGSFSFYPTKVITSAEGGMIATADQRIRDEALMYRDQGKAGFLGNLNVRQGYAWRISELHAAVGLVHLRRLKEFLAVRHRIAEQYTQQLQPVGRLRAMVPTFDPGCNYYKYVVLLADGIDRVQVKGECKRRFGVTLAGEVYERPLHQQPVFEHLARSPLPVAERVCGTHICLPLHSDMTVGEAERVIDAISAVTAAG